MIWNVLEGAIPNFIYESWRAAWDLPEVSLLGTGHGKRCPVALFALPCGFCDSEAPPLPFPLGDLVAFLFSSEGWRNGWLFLPWQSL